MACREFDAKLAWKWQSFQGQRIYDSKIGGTGRTERIFAIRIAKDLEIRILKTK